jgi:hypothetical protein
MHILTNLKDSCYGCPGWALPKKYPILASWLAQPIHAWLHPGLPGVLRRFETSLLTPGPIHMGYHIGRANQKNLLFIILLI